LAKRKWFEVKGKNNPGGQKHRGRGAKVVGGVEKRGGAKSQGERGKEGCKGRGTQENPGEKMRRLVS